MYLESGSHAGWFSQLMALLAMTNTLENLGELSWKEDTRCHNERPIFLEKKECFLNVS